MFEIILTLFTILLSIIDSFGKELLDAHNKYRAVHGVPALKWSTEAASKAKSWGEELAKKKIFRHGDHKGMGQNLFMSSKDTNAQHVVETWYNEIKNYDFERSCFIPNTGHFTQVVWLSTTHVGAAKIIHGSNCFVVANYSPPGNVERHFEKNVKKAN